MNASGNNPSGVSQLPCRQQPRTQTPMSSIDPLRQRSHSFSITRPLYPIHSFTLPSRDLSCVSEDPSQTPNGIRGWDTYSLSGQISPKFLSAQFSTTSSTSKWFTESPRHPVGRKDVILNIERLENLARMSRKYEDSLRAVSDASMQFANALDDFSRTKELNTEDDNEIQNEGGEQEDMVEGFRSLSGYQYYTGNQQGVLAQLVNMHCTVPLEAQLEAYRSTLFVKPPPLLLSLKLLLLFYVGPS